jgi:hypothetical protein
VADIGGDFPFWARYDDGSSERLSKEQLVERLVPREHESLVLAERETAKAAPSSAASYGEPLPDSFQLAEAAGLTAALQIVMPGYWAPEGSRPLQLPSLLRQDGESRASNLEADLQTLLQAVAFSSEQSIADPFSGAGVIEQVLARENLSVFSNDVDSNMTSSWHRDALQPSFYSDLSAYLGGLDAVVMSPPARFIDLALPLAVRCAREVVCCRVPDCYLAGAPPGRAAFLAWLQRQGRISVVVNASRGTQLGRSAWLCVFASPLIRGRFGSSVEWLQWEAAP